jgi:hypothetical protein
VQCVGEPTFLGDYETRQFFAIAIFVHSFKKLEGVALETCLNENVRFACRDSRRQIGDKKKQAQRFKLYF